MTRLLSIDVGIKNLAYCLFDNQKVTAWDVIRLNSETDAGRCKEFAGLFDSLFSNIDCVLIEKQPSKNPIMRTMGGMLLAYFVLKKVKRVLLYSPKYKLRCYDGTPITVVAGNRYLENKKLSIEHTRILVADEWRAFFESHKKKDDLADSFLQGLSFIRFNDKEAFPSKKECERFYTTLKAIVDKSTNGDTGVPFDEYLERVISSNYYLTKTFNKFYTIDTVIDLFGEDYYDRLYA